ncbi:MAG: hypothetical protein M1833_003265 [Piccolia ochrophora]|nr:MAG: hypothetical protein M1833_003265 [Piccolia ochrophora]
MALPLAGSLGNLIRLEPLPLDRLPHHPAFDEIKYDRSPANGKYSNGTTKKTIPPENGPKLDVIEDQPRSDNELDQETTRQGSFTPAPERPDLLVFIEEVINQATAFVGELTPLTRGVTRPDWQDQEPEPGSKVDPPKRWTTKAPKKFKKTPIDIYKRTVTKPELIGVAWDAKPVPRRTPQFEDKESCKNETWFARVSEHTDVIEQDTVNYNEFLDGLKVEHALHEQEYTPELVDAHQVLAWDIAPAMTAGESGVLTMSIHEMTHKLPFPLSPRTFPVLIITAIMPRSAFIVVQIPLADVSSLPMSRAHITSAPPTVPGIYASIERCQSWHRLASIDVHDGRTVEWLMATASDAKGVLPGWLQASAIPGAISKDVGRFIEWVASTRGVETD